MTKKEKLKNYSEEERLEDAEKWIFDYEETDIEKAYCDRYGVDVFAASQELKSLGYFETDESEDDIFDGDDKPQSYMESQFEFILGYTSGGVPYGIKKEDNDIDDGDLELPF
ncbi:MAG: hypothetical protein R6V14_01995 [Halanaerobiales bacterium]